MMRQRKAFPLVALLGFEVLAIVGLQALGSNAKMQVPWDELTVWLQNGSVDEIAAPIIRLFALGVAYWMFGSTALFAIAQASRIPAAIRATSAFTLPSVRRVVDGAVAVSIVTTSFVGLSATAASASTAAPPAVTVSFSNDLTVPTPALGDAAANAAATPAAQQGAGGQDSMPTPGTAAPEENTTPEADSAPTPDTGAPEAPAENSGGGDNPATPTPTTPEAAPGESQTPDDTTPPSTEAPTTEAPTTQAPTTEAPTTTQAPTPAAPTAGNPWVPTPRPGEPVEATTTTTTAAPAAPQAAPEEKPEVLGAQEHRVVPGDNLWTISRDALASSMNKPASEITEAQVRDYWLKVIEANRDNLRSGDPHWIFPGEVISLPTAS